MRQIKNVCTWVPEQRYSQEEALVVLGLQDSKRARRIFTNAATAINYRHLLLDPAYGSEESMSHLQFPKPEDVCCHIRKANHIIEVSNLATPHFQRTDLEYFHSSYRWCVGAIRGLEMASKQNGRSVVITVDINSQLRWRPDFSDTNDIVAFALFGDGIASTEVEDAPADQAGGANIVGFSFYHCERKDLVKYDRGKLYLGRDIAEEAPPLINHCLKELLNGNGVVVKDIAHWIVHPGGQKILDRLGDYLGVQSHLHYSRAILKRYGNIGASSMFFILNDIIESKPVMSSYGVMLGFGPGHEGGFDVGACLLQW